MVGWWVLIPSYFSQDVVLSDCLQHYYVVCARQIIMRPQPTHGQLATPTALDHRVHPTNDPTRELVIYAVSGPGKQPSWAASDGKPATGAVDLSAGAAIRESAPSAAGACCCQSVLLLLAAASQCCCCCCCFDDDDCSCIFAFGHISI